MRMNLRKYCCCSLALLLVSAPAWSADFTVRPVASTDAFAVIDVTDPFDTSISMRPGESVMLEVEIATWGAGNILRALQVEFDNLGLTSGTAGSLSLQIMDSDAPGVCNAALASAGMCQFCASTDFDGLWIDECRSRCGGLPTGDLCDPADPTHCAGDFFACFGATAWPDFVWSMAGIVGATPPTSNAVEIFVSMSNNPGAGPTDDNETHYVASILLTASATAEGTFTMTQFVDQAASLFGGTFSRDASSQQIGAIGTCPLGTPPNVPGTSCDFHGQVRITIVPPCTGAPDCDDGLACNGSETCDIPSGICQAGTPLACDDGVFCNGVETCDEAAGCLPGAPVDCDNGIFCDGVETCDAVADACVDNADPACDDGVNCTDDSCNAGTDSCDNIANNGYCDDGLFCNGSETCDQTLDCQAGTAVDCDDGVFCNGVETCDNVAGACQSGTPELCDDGVDCTDDSCNAGTDSCDNITNAGNCFDFDPCSAATCDAVTGCSFADVNGDVCLIDADCQANGAPNGACDPVTLTCTCQAGPINELCLIPNDCGGGNADPLDQCNFPGEQCGGGGNCVNGPLGPICVDQCCYDTLETFTIDIELSETTSPACGAQAFLGWDIGAMDLVSVETDPDSELGMTTELVNIVGNGTIDLAIGIPLALQCAADCADLPDAALGGTCAGGTIARLTFDAIDVCKTPGVWIRWNNPCTVVSGSTGALAIGTCNGGGLCPKDKGVMGDATDPININESAPIWDCDQDGGTLGGNADCGGTTVNVDYPPLTVVDSCDDITQSVHHTCDAGTPNEGAACDPADLVDDCGNGTDATDCNGLCTVTYFAACGADRDCGLGVLCDAGNPCAVGTCVPGDPDDPNPLQPFFCTTDVCGTSLAGFCDTAGDLADTGLTDADVLGGGADFPPGHYDVSCSASNSCGGTGTCDFVIENSGDNTVVIDVELSPTMAPGSASDTIVRCIDFELAECGAFTCPNGDACDPQNPNACGGGPEPLCKAVSISMSQEIVIGAPSNAPGHGTAMFKVPPGNWDCITATDPAHSLAASCFLDCVDNQFVASFKGTPEQSPTCHWLVQGNLDGNDHIDVIDFTLLAGAYLSQAPNGNDSPCLGGTDADINGDGVVTLADYSFIIVNFFDQDKDPCAVVCNPGAEAPKSEPLGEISVRSLRALGYGAEARVADVDGNGVVNLNDMALFVQDSADDPDAAALLEAVSNRLSEPGMR